MSDQDSLQQQTRRVVVSEPGAPFADAGSATFARETVVVQRRPNPLTWWIAGVVALAAIAGVVWMVVATDAGTPDEPPVVVVTPETVAPA